MVPLCQKQNNKFYDSDGDQLFWEILFTGTKYEYFIKDQKFITIRVCLKVFTDEQTRGSCCIAYAVHNVYLLKLKTIFVNSNFRIEKSIAFL